MVVLLKTFHPYYTHSIAFCKKMSLFNGHKNVTMLLMNVSGDQLLMHYDVKKPIQLACDASPYGVGAIISHIMPDGSERPIALESRTLIKAEKGYAELGKEALSLIVGVKNFHKYLYGREFTLLTDHRPLQTILGKTTGKPTLAAGRF